MKKYLQIVSASLILCCFSAIVHAQTCEWRLANPTFSAVDPDGVGPATGVVTFTLQIHAVSGTIPNINVISTGWSYQSLNAMVPTTQGCGIVSNPTNVVVSPEFIAGGFAYTTVNQCGNFNQTAGGQNFDKRAVGTLDGTGITLTTTWVNVFTVTLWSLGNSAPNGGYVVINSGSSGTNVPTGIVFPTYSVSDDQATEFGVNSLTYTTPLPLVTGPLPVTISKYDVKCSSRGTALSWSTSAEYSSNYFEVEKSVNGLGTDWKAIGRTKAAGTSSIQQNYQYLDLEAGIAAYRIKQVDLNGRTTYTDIKRSSCEAKSLDVLLYPIPTRDRLTVAIKSSKAARTNLNVIDATGRIVLRQNSTVINAGSNNILLDVHTLPAGEYILVSSDPSVYINQKFIIAR